MKEMNKEFELYIILKLISHCDEIKGKTRLIKYLFLLEKESNLRLNFNFIPKHYGPYSKQLDKYIQELQELDYINERLDDDNKALIYKIKKPGYESLISLEQKYDSSSIIKDIKSIIDKFQNITLRELLEIVYAKYPEYTDLSKLNY